MRRRRTIAAALAATLLTFALAGTGHAANPIITHIYTADPAALVVGNTVYLYTGHDEAPVGGTTFVMRDWHVFSSTDMASWTDQARTNSSRSDMSLTRSDASRPPVTWRAQRARRRRVGSGL